jgi:hypothetical protein
MKTSNLTQLLQFPFLNELSSYVECVFVTVAASKEQLPSLVTALQTMDNEEPLVKLETIDLPAIKEEYVVSIDDVPFEVFVLHRR